MTRREGVGAQMRGSSLGMGGVGGHKRQRARLRGRRGWSWGDLLSCLPGTVLVVMLKSQVLGSPTQRGELVYETGKPGDTL